MTRFTTLAALLLGASATLAAEPSVQAQVDASRAAAARYWDLSVALAEGYEQLFDCTEGDHGNMGQHFIHADRAGDGELVLEDPDVLMYEPQPDGTMQLVAMEGLLHIASDARAREGFLDEIEHFPSRVNLGGFPRAGGSDSGCVLGGEASMHGEIPVRGSAGSGD